MPEAEILPLINLSILMDPNERIHLMRNDIYSKSGTYKVENKYKYTIIIPHKNIPDLLQRCLDSIPKRNDIQVVVVDDNSDPNLVNFSQFPGIGNSNIEVYFDKSGKGAGRARNVGLEHAKGEWILFSDADDYYDTENLNKLLNSDIESYDVIAWIYKKIDSGCEIFCLDYGKERNNPDKLYYMNEPWRKMVRYSLIQDHGIRFQESMVSNDLFFSKQIAYHCTRYMFYNEVIYYWQVRKDSLSYKYHGEKLRSALDVSIFVNRYLVRLGKDSYLDRTPYYMRILWKESFVLYCYYLMKICFTYGYVYLKKLVRRSILFRCGPIVCSLLVI